jgi:hypothetical protein
MINDFNKHFLSKNIFWQRTWKIIFFLNTVFLLFLMRERDRFRLFVSKRYCVPTRSFLGVPDRSPFLTVSERSWSSIVKKNIFNFLLFDSCGAWKMLWNVYSNCKIWSKIEEMGLFLVENFITWKNSHMPGKDFTPWVYA